MAHKVADQPGILADPPGATAIGDARGLYHRGVVAHVVDDAHKTVVQHRHGGEQHVFQRRHGGASRLHALCPLGLDFG